MGDIFSLGFGPFRWVCTSCDPDDLNITDQIAAEVMEDLIKSGGNVLPCRVMRNAVPWLVVYVANEKIFEPFFTLGQ